MSEALVRGDSPAALGAALELAEVGVRVRVELGDEPRWPNGPVRDLSGALRELLRRIAAPLSDGGPAQPDAEPRTLAPRPVLLRDRRGEWARIPEPQILGVPAVPVSAEALAFLGGGAAVRAYLDRVRPLLTIGKTHEFGRLVRARMGTRLLGALVEPLVRERYGVAAGEVEVAIAAPGLNEALTRTGSLSGAVLSSEERTAEREALVVPAAGWSGAREALLERLALFGVEFEATSDAPHADTARVIDAAVPAGPVRGHARVPLEDPGLPMTDADALQTVVLANGERWSVRVTLEDDWVARVSGPRLEAETPANPAGAAMEALQLSGLRASGEIQAEWRAAPHVTRAERDAAALRLETQREEQPGELLVGAALHSDDDSAGVHDAVEAAVVLRRRLTGISG